MITLQILAFWCWFQVNWLKYNTTIEIYKKNYGEFPRLLIADI